MAQAMSELAGFLTSALGVLLVGSLIGAVGLFTWRRWDWNYKEIHHRSQLLLDRKVELIENIDNDASRFSGKANEIIIAFMKQAPDEQINKTVEAYNEQQAEWFSKTVSYQVLLRFHFTQPISDKFTKIIEATENLDRVTYSFALKPDQQTSAQANEAFEEVKAQLSDLNTLVLQQLYSTS